MTSAAASMSRPAPPSGRPPYERLTIYYLNGRAGHGPFPFDDRFIGNWEEDDCSFLFFSAAADNAVRRFLRHRPELILADTFDMSYEEWQSLDAFPLVAGGWCVYPPWLPRPAIPDTRPVLLDPGVVFGSGAHTTTRDCLEALAALRRETGGQALDSAVDIGTGTGLLAVCASLSGCRRVVALDINFLAARTAHNNARLNKVADRIMVCKGDGGAFAHDPPDLLMANIHYDVMRRLIAADSFCSCRYFILSGLLRTPARKARSQLEQLPVKIIKIWNTDQIWCTILGKVL